MGVLPFPLFSSSLHLRKSKKNERLEIACSLVYGKVTVAERQHWRPFKRSLNSHQNPLTRGWGTGFDGIQLWLPVPVPWENPWLYLHGLPYPLQSLVRAGKGSQDVDKGVLNQYFIPLSSTAETIDSVVILKNVTVLFQMTVSPSHSLNLKGITELTNELPAMVKKKICIVFVVPDHDTTRKPYKRQNIVIPHGVPKHVSDLVAAYKQYVYYFPMDKLWLVFMLLPPKTCTYARFWRRLFTPSPPPFTLEDEHTPHHHLPWPSKTSMFSRAWPLFTIPHTSHSPRKWAPCHVALCHSPQPPPTRKQAHFLMVFLTF